MTAWPATTEYAGSSAHLTELLAAIAAGADGLLIEVHNDPANAWCDGAQSITPAQFAELMPKVAQIAACVGRTV